MPSPPVPSAFLRAAVEAVAGDEPLPEAVRTQVLDDVARFVHAQLAALPAELQLAHAAGMLAFRLTVRARTRASFAALPLDRRRALVEEWAAGPIAPLRQLFRALRTTTLLAWYDHPRLRKEAA